jgi:hypothetical protein
MDWELPAGLPIPVFRAGPIAQRLEQYVVDGRRILQKIDGSRNLGQTSESIKKDAFEFLGAMESKLRQSMGILSAMKAERDKQTR